jgi:enterochelin esterase-like enzyme
VAIAINGRHVTFTAPPGATALVGDFTGWEDDPIPLRAGESVSLEFPAGAFIEYAFLGEDQRPFADPDNTVESENPWYRYPRAAVLDGYQPGPLRELLPGAAPGRLERLAWEGKVFPGTRRALVHVPAGLEPGKSYPLVLVQDGIAYARTAKLGNVLDNLLHLGRVRPAVLAFIEPADRTSEYYLNDKYVDLLLSEAIPQVAEAFPVSARREERCLWGASLGGLASLYAAFRRPEEFSVVVSQSGAFQAEPGPPKRKGAGEWMAAQLATAEKLDLRVSLECGTQEWLLGANRRMAAVLFDKGYRHRYQERQSGHNWVTWRDGLADSLQYVLGQ